MKLQQRGFTLIELVVVITILGILAAFALPRFAGLEQSARRSAVDGMAGSVRAASALAHSVALVNGGASNASVSMEGATITMTGYYPTADAAGIVNALQDTTGFDTATVDGEFQLSGAPTPGTCKVTYTASTGGGTVPGIAATYTGC